MIVPMPRKLTSQIEPDALEAYSLHQQGQLPREISGKLGVSLTRACLLISKGSRAARAQEILKEVPDDMRMLADAGFLPRRTAHLFQMEGISRLSELASYGEETLRCLPGLGAKGLDRLMGLLDRFDIRLADDSRADPDISRRRAAWRG
jgi:hypothetical protein